MELVSDIDIKISFGDRPWMTPNIDAAGANMVKVAGPYDLEAVRREWIGKRGPESVGLYPVEYEPIRRYCHMIEDANPLFLDPEFAASTRFGGVIAPPTMVEVFAEPGPWPPSDDPPNILHEVPTRGDRPVNLIQEMEMLAPVRVGDRLSRYTVVVDIIEKAVRLDPKAIWITGSTRLSVVDGLGFCGWGR